MSDIQVPNSRALECMKVWYSLFTVIMDAPESEISNMEKLAKLYKLRSRIKHEAPELADEARTRVGSRVSEESTTQVIEGYRNQAKLREGR